MAPIHPLTGLGSHPLRVEEVFTAAGITQPPVSDERFFGTCSVCGTRQAFTEAELREGTEPLVITEYWCVNGCEVLGATGHPSPIPLPAGTAYRLKNFAFFPGARTEQEVPGPSEPTGADGPAGE